MQFRLVKTLLNWWARNDGAGFKQVALHRDNTNNRTLFLHGGIKGTIEHPTRIQEQ